MPDQAAWASALDDFEARLAACAAAGELDGELALAPWPPPALRGPVPPSLVERAQRLLAEASAVEAALRAQQRDLPPVRNRRFSPASPATRSGSRFSASL